MMKKILNLRMPRGAWTAAGVGAVAPFLMAAGGNSLDEILRTNDFPMWLALLLSTVSAPFTYGIWRAGKAVRHAVAGFLDGKADEMLKDKDKTNDAIARGLKNASRELTRDDEQEK